MKLAPIQLKGIVRDYFDNSIEETTFDKESVLDKINANEVSMVKFYEQPISGLLSIKGKEGRVLFISTLTGKVFEAKFSKVSDKNVLEFSDQEHGTDFINHVKAGLKYEHYVKHENYYKKNNLGEDFKSDASGNVNLDPASEKPGFTFNDNEPYGSAIIIKKGFESLITRPKSKSPKLRIELYRPPEGFAKASLEVKLNYALRDADYLMKSESEIFGDAIIDTLGTLGTIIGVGLLPFTAGASGATLSLAGRMLSIVSTPAFSAGLTAGTGVAPKIMQAIYADRVDEAKGYMLDAFGASLGEGVGYVGGKVVGRLLSKIKASKKYNQLSDSLEQYLTKRAYKKIEQLKKPTLSAANPP